MTRLIDLSQDIVAGMPVYPGDDQTELVQTKFLDRHYHNNHRLTIGMHAGTHLDSPMHLLPSNVYLTEQPLQSFIGSGCLLDVRDQPLIFWKPEYERLVTPGGIVLLYTGHDRHYGSERYYLDRPCVDASFCSFLLRKRIKVLGMDLPSPDQPPFPVHKQLLASGVYILENLTNLGQLLGPESFEVIALPLKLRADSSPTRAVARVFEDPQERID